jgi:hypothetical protein
VTRSDVRKLARFIPDCLVLFRRLLGDERVPRPSVLRSTPPGLLAEHWRGPNESLAVLARLAG